MAMAEPDTVVLEEDEVELMFGEPSRKLKPAEEAAYQKYQAKWDEQDRLKQRDCRGSARELMSMLLSYRFN